jgi:nucleotide-binding universal stress UspA family protein
LSLLLTQHAPAGSRGFTGLRRFLIGSVSSYIVESEAAPCLVVRSSLPRLPVCSGEASAATVRNEGGPSDVAATEIERGRVVAIAVDGSPAGTALVQWSRQFALRPRDRVFILHGRPDKPKTDDELEAIDRAIVSVNTALAALREVKEELDIAPVAEILPEGNVRDAIIDWVDTHRADVLVVGSRGLGGALKRAVLGSVSTYAIEHAACAVLVVSAPVLAKLAAATASEEAEASSVGVVVSHAVASAVAAGQQ